MYYLGTHKKLIGERKPEFSKRIKKRWVEWIEINEVLGKIVKALELAYQEAYLMPNLPEQLKALKNVQANKETLLRKLGSTGENPVLYHYVKNYIGIPKR